MIKIASKSDSVRSLGPGLRFSNTRGREDREQTPAVAPVKDVVPWICVAKEKTVYRATLKTELMEPLIGCTK